MKNSRNLYSEHGFVLVAVYLVVGILAIITIAYFASHNVFLQSAERNKNKIIAFNMAETAVDVALTQLTTDKSYTGTNGYISLSTESLQGGYSVTVATPDDNVNIRIIQATGYAPDNNPSSRAVQQVNLVANAEIPQSDLFDFAIFAENSITLTSSGNVASIDSYNSNSGAYDSSTAGSEGDIAVNATEADTIKLMGNTLVKGDAYVGSGGDPATGISMGPNTSITGSKSSLSEPKVYDTVNTSVAVSGSIDLSGKMTQTLSAGTYHFSSISITGQAQLIFEGEVKIFVDGDVDISGQGIATADNKPTNFLLYGLGSGTIKISGQGNLYAGIYAPQCDVQNVGNGDLLGAVVSETYSQTGNSAIHFDEALKELKNTDVPVKPIVKAWQEEGSLLWNT